MHHFRSCKIFGSNFLRLKFGSLSAADLAAKTQAESFCVVGLFASSLTFCARTLGLAAGVASKYLLVGRGILRTWLAGLHGEPS